MIVVPDELFLGSRDDCNDDCPAHEHIHGDEFIPNISITNGQSDDA